MTALKKMPPGNLAGNPSGNNVNSAKKTYRKTANKSTEKLTPQAKWTRENPKARWAHVALASALRRGLIERKPCEICGAEPADGHHPDYDKPMHVIWLCRLHHKQVHRRDGI